MVATRSQKWTCSRCGVSVSRMDGDSIPLPDNWSSVDDGDFCLACRRLRAAEAALDAAPADGNREAQAQLRRTGLIEFEVRRTPDLPDSAIARACRSSVSAVAATRKRLRDEKHPVG